MLDNLDTIVSFHCYLNNYFTLLIYLNLIYNTTREEWFNIISNYVKNITVTFHHYDILIFWELIFVRSRARRIVWRGVWHYLPPARWSDDKSAAAGTWEWLPDALNYGTVVTTPRSSWNKWRTNDEINDAYRDACRMFSYLVRRNCSAIGSRSKRVSSGEQTLVSSTNFCELKNIMQLETYVVGVPSMILNFDHLLI